MINPWFIAGGAALVVGSYFYGYSTGYDIAKSAWESEKAAAIKDTMDQVLAANDKVRSLEQALATKQNKVEKVYVDKIRTVEVERKQLADIARSDGLFIAATCPDNSGSVSNTATSASSRNGAEKARLSAEAADALISLAADADRIVNQLTACQEILSSERELQRSP